MIYEYVIDEEFEIDWGVFAGYTAHLFSDEKISETEWKEIVTDAFFTIYNEKGLVDVQDIEKYILEHDKRFKTVESFIVVVRRSEFMNSENYSEEELEGTEDWVQTEPDEYGDNYLLKP